MANNFQRLFYIFKNMDRDEGCPTGYIRVEINGDKAKLQISISNLVNRKGLSYQVYGIKKAEKQLAYSAICDVPNDNGRADIKMDIDINSVGSNKLKLGDINIFAVVTNLSDRAPLIKYPLVAYTKGEIPWRDEFENALLNEELHSGNSDAKNNAIINNSGVKLREANVKDNLSDSKQPDNDSLIGKDSEITQLEQINSESDALGNPACRQAETAFDIINDIENVSKDMGNSLCSEENGTIEIIKDQKEDTCRQLENAMTLEINNNESCTGKEVINVEDIDRVGSCKNEDNIPGNVAGTLNIEEGQEAEIGRNKHDVKYVFQGGKEADRGICSETLRTGKQVSEEVTDGKGLQKCGDKSEQTIDSKEGTLERSGAGNYYETPLSISDKFESAVTSVYNADRSIQADQERTSVLVSDDNDIERIDYKDFEDKSAVHTDSRKSVFSMPSLKEELNKSFESYNPFKVKSKNFVWWKINSPGYLNNILFRNNIRTYLLFNPKVMLAHYKYRYIILGIRNDKRSGREYLMCGVPGVYDIDQNPFGNMGSWAQTEGIKPKYGAFGYWVIMIDPRTGKLMKVK